MDDSAEITGEDTKGVESGAAAGGDAWSGSTRDYTYKELLTRVFQILRQNNPDLAGEKKRYTLVPPQVMREGTKKTMFANVVEISKRMRREPDHLIQYLFAELGTTGSIDGGQRLIIKGRFQQKQIENILKRYIVEYVTCKTCKSGDTLLSKENRLFFLQCQSCGSTKSVSAIKTGFMAQTQKRSGWCCFPYLYITFPFSPACGCWCLRDQVSCIRVSHSFDHIIEPRLVLAFTQTCFKLIFESFILFDQLVRIRIKALRQC
ncbi:domain found in IF2B/IF5-domain-containing protein [Chytridium lagenaria]|nr:domain found in IF2B/IF5-domain-containing protein [Chytridium lagenaria]